MKTCRVLLIGRRLSVLEPLAAALSREGIEADFTQDAAGASLRFSANYYDLIAFGRGIDPKERARLRMEFSWQNPEVRYAVGIAPVVPLLVGQIKNALRKN